ncbi:MAG: DUF1361 domain-containing protein [Iamia sp.]
MRHLLGRSAYLGLDVARHLGPWMVFNAFLATVPVVLAVVLFHRGRNRTAGWWLGVVAFVLFLPNAPYVVTDIIHAGPLVDFFADRSRVAPLVVLAAIAALALYGLAAYAVCLAEIDRELDRAGRSTWRVPVHAAVHLLSAFGVVLGRIPRLNSWYVVTQPEAVVDGVGSVARPLAVPLVLVLALGFALGAAAVAAVGRAVAERTRSVAALGRRGVQRLASSA